MVKTEKELPHLRKLLLNSLLVRLVLPLTLVGVIALLMEGYLGEKKLLSKQQDVAESISHIVDYHIDHGERILDSIARTDERSETVDLSLIMESALNAYEYFDTIYCLDGNNRITLMTPYDPRYNGLDLSNMPDFKKDAEGKRFNVSRPFISLRTGEPTVYIVRYLSGGGCVIGELKLNLFQKEISNISEEPGKDFVFIMDQAGTVLAHPSLELVKQQINMRNSGIFQSMSAGKTKEVYRDNGRLVVGSAAKVEKTGWIVVNQVSLNVYESYYAWTLGLTLLASSIIWALLAWSFGKRLQKYITVPLERLSEGTNALTSGNFQQASLLSSISTTFAELNKLSLDFQLMSNKLLVRETALQESEKRFRSLFDEVPIGLFRASLSGKIIEVNAMAESILGYPDREELLKVDFYSLMNKDCDNISELHSDKSMANLINFETELRRFDGTIIIVQINTHMISEPDEQEQHFEGSIEDITLRKQTENKIREQQELLLKAEKGQRETLEKALVMKDEFISLISHELKTPLNVIYSALQLIESVYIKQIPERVKGLIGSIKQNTFRQLRLANNLLDVTRLNAGQYKLNPKNIDLVYLTKVITESVDIYAAQKEIKISFKSEIISRNICIDDEKYERILLNLIANAIKFTENGGQITVEIDEDSISNSIQISVTDTGIGIPKEKQDLIFERFGQVDSNLSRRAEGAGIGLSLVKLLVNTLGGTIKVESEPGFGSTFTILLPLREEICDCEAGEVSEIEDRLVTEIKVQFSDIYF